MKKIGVLVATFLFLIPNFTFAKEVKIEKLVPAKSISQAVAPVDKKNDLPKDITITSPKEIASITGSGKFLISGISSLNDVVNIDTYSLIIAQDNEDSVQTPLENYKFTIDDLGVFAQEISLNKGDNLVVIKISRGKNVYELKYIITYSDNITDDLIKKVRNLSSEDII